MFNGEVASTNDEDIDLLMGIKTPGADNIVGGKKKADEGQEPNEDLEPEDDETPPIGTLPKKKVVKIDETPAQKVKKNADEVTDDLFGKDDEEELDEKGNPKKKSDAVGAKKAAVPSNTEVDYKAVYEAMVEDGVFGEVEVPEDFVWDADGFKQIQALQVDTQYNNILDKTGPYGKAIIEYEKNGGNPAEMLTLFREQQTVQKFDITTPEGQEEFLTSYYEAQDYTTKSIDRTIKALIDQGADVLKEEAEEKKTLWDAQYEAEIANTQKQQELVAKQMAEQARNFNKTISDSLTGDAELTPKERKELGAYILSYSQKFNGHDVSQFYLDMAEIQKDPAAYVELAKFIKGLKTGDYKKKIADKSKKEVNAKTFLKVKNGNALSQRDGGQTPLTEGGDESSFVSYLTRKTK